MGIAKVLSYISNLLNKEDEVLYPSAILGTSAGGMSLYDITKLYHNYFRNINSDFDNEMLGVLNDILTEKQT